MRTAFAAAALLLACASGGASLRTRSRRAALPEVPETLSPAEADAFLAKLTDAQVRALLARELKARAKKEAGASAKAEPQGLGPLLMGVAHAWRASNSISASAPWSSRTVSTQLPAAVASGVGDLRRTSVRAAFHPRRRAPRRRRGIVGRAPRASHSADSRQPSLPRSRSGHASRRARCASGWISCVRRVRARHARGRHAAFAAGTPGAQHQHRLRGRRHPASRPSRSCYGSRFRPHSRRCACCRSATTLRASSTTGCSRSGRITIFGAAQRACSSLTPASRPRAGACSRLLGGTLVALALLFMVLLAPLAAPVARARRFYVLGVAVFWTLARAGRPPEPGRRRRRLARHPARLSAARPLGRPRDRRRGAGGDGRSRDGVGVPLRWAMRVLIAVLLFGAANELWGFQYFEWQASLRRDAGQRELRPRRRLCRRGARLAIHQDRDRPAPAAARGRRRARRRRARGCRRCCRSRACSSSRASSRPP